MLESATFTALVAERRPAQAVAKILLDWGVIISIFILLSLYPSWPVFILAFVVIGIEQHALGLWMHEGGHWLLAKNKRINDAITALLLSGPLLVPFHSYRARHFTHHGYLGTERDTKGVIYTPIHRKNFLSFLVKNCFGLQFFDIAKGYIVRTSVSQDASAPSTSLRTWAVDLAPIILSQCIIFVSMMQFLPRTYYIWFWLLPWLTLNRFIGGLRAIIEHQPLTPEHHPFTRTLRPTLIDVIIFCRAGFDYHWTHHQFPSIPCFNLKSIPLEGVQPIPSQRKGYLTTLWMIVRQR